MNKANPFEYTREITELRRLRYMGNTHGMVSNDINLP